MSREEIAMMRCIKLEEWMQGERKLLLQHGLRYYLLTITRKGKLILTAADESSTTLIPPSAHLSCAITDTST